MVTSVVALYMAILVVFSILAVSIFSARPLIPLSQPRPPSGAARLHMWPTEQLRQTQCV